MLEKRQGLRSLYSEMFKEGVDDLPVIEAQGRAVSERGKQVLARIKTIEREVRRLPIGEQIKDFLRQAITFKSAVPSDLDEEYEQTLREVRSHALTYLQTCELIRLVAGALPGKHELRGLEYDADNNRLQPVYRVDVRGEAPNLDYVIGRFDKIRYRTVRGGDPVVIVPREDSVPPVLSIPKRSILPVIVTGYDGPGSLYGTAIAVWKPEIAPKARWINPREFQIAA